MKAVLISIKPKWCELILQGKKTVEVRKTKPKIDEPFKCYIYCTQGDALAYPCLNNPKFEIHRTGNGTLNGRKMTAKEREQSDHTYANGKVIGEFVCDKFYDIIQYGIGAMVYTDNLKTVVEPSEFIELSCLSEEQIFEYIGNKDGYGWHITDLVIYDKPKELGEFYVEGDCDCLNCKKCYWFDKGNGFNVEDDCNLAYKGMAEHKSYKPIIRPPQSWCYVEELGV